MSEEFKTNLETISNNNGPFQTCFVCLFFATKTLVEGTRAALVISMIDTVPFADESSKVQDIRFTWESRWLLLFFLRIEWSAAIPLTVHWRAENTRKSQSGQAVLPDTFSLSVHVELGNSTHLQFTKLWSYVRTDQVNAQMQTSVRGKVKVRVRICLFVFLFFFSFLQVNIF